MLLPHFVAPSVAVALASSPLAARSSAVAPLAGAAAGAAAPGAAARDLLAALFPHQAVLSLPLFAAAGAGLSTSCLDGAIVPILLLARRLYDRGRGACFRFSSWRVQEYVKATSTRWCLCFRTGV